MSCLMLLKFLLLDIENLSQHWDILPGKRWETQLLEVYLGLYIQLQNIKLLYICQKLSPINPNKYLIYEVLEWLTGLFYIIPTRNSWRSN